MTPPHYHKNKKELALCNIDILTIYVKQNFKHKGSAEKDLYFHTFSVTTYIQDASRLAVGEINFLASFKFGLIINC